MSNPEFELNGAIIEINENNKFNSIMEIDLIANEKNNSGKIQIWEDGKLVKNETMTLADELFEKNSSADSDSISTMSKSLGDRWKIFSDCLSSQGVSTALIALAASICGGACGVTWGAGCAPCFYGLSFISGGIIGHCFQKALK